MTDTGGAAAFDLVLQTGASPVFKKGIVALAYLEQLLDQVQGAPRCAGTGIGSEIFPPVIVLAPVKTQPGKIILAGQVKVRIAFVVPEKDVIAGFQLLDEVTFQ